MKLQLYQQTIRNGEDHQPLYNGSDASRGILDIRIGGLFTWPSSYKGTVTMLSFSDSGFYVYVIQPLFSRIGDYKALVLFVPRQVARTAAPGLSRVVGALADNLTAGKDPSLLAPLFNKDYPEENLHFGPVAKSGRYAFCLYGGKSPLQGLDAVFGESVLQKRLMRHEGVFFLRADDRKIVNDGKMEDVSQLPPDRPSLSLWLLQDEASLTPFAQTWEEGKRSGQKIKKKKRLSMKFVAGLVVGLLLGGMSGWVAKAWLTDDVLTQPDNPPLLLPVDTTDVLVEDSLPADDTLRLDTFLSEEQTL